VTISSPGQGDEVGEYVTVTGTVTGAVSVFVVAPGGGGAGSAVGGTFAVSTRVGVQHAAIVVEAVNADGTGRAAVHVLRPAAPEWLPEDEEAHAQAFLAQKDAAQEAELAKFRAAIEHPTLTHSRPAAIVPKSYDELIGRLTTPDGGEVAISPGDVAQLLPPDAAWAGQLVSNVSVDGQVVTVQTPLGSGAGSLWADAGGRIVFDATTVRPGQQMVSENLANTIQTHLDRVTDRLRRAGLRVSDARVEAGRIWIRTAPR
jgi:hypothetical protein